MADRIPRFTLEGVRDAAVSEHPFHTEDGLRLTLTRFHRADSEDVVLLVHGLTSSSDMYIMPEHRNLVSFLLDNGFGDVWALDSRISGRFPYDFETHRYTLDDVAHYDHPAALAVLREHIGARRLHVISHCLGAVTFAMSLFGGVVDGVRSLVCNSVALTPRVGRWSKVKLTCAPALSEYVLGLPFTDPRFAIAPPFTRGWLLSRAVSLYHRKCGSMACHMLSFMWGNGKPIFNHAKMSPVTHDRLADLFGAVGLHYYRHVRKMVAAGRTVRFDPADPRHAALPDDYLANAAKIDTPMLLLTGDRNDVFADSNIVCHRTLDRLVPGQHELAVLPGYGHQDPFMGRDADTEVFPVVLDFLRRRAS